MKTLIAALILSSLTGPVFASSLTDSASPADLVIGTEGSSADEFGRRSGRCSHRPEAIPTMNQIVPREGSACGGV